jgi:carbonic anhydrase
MRSVEITYRYGGPAGTARPRPADAEAARSRLNDGNRAFATLPEGLAGEDAIARRVVDMDPCDLGLGAEGPTAPSQRPYAAVIGCSDARVPVELIFNEGPNDLFVIRIAGNGLGGDVLGSLKYAIQHLSGSLRLVVVLAHSGCGAMTAAVDVFLKPAGYLTLTNEHALRGLLDRKLIVVQTCAKFLATMLGPEVAERPRYREALIEMAIAFNAALVAHTVQKEIDSGTPSGVRAVYGVYLLPTREVWSLAAVDGDQAGLSDPPVDQAGFVALGGTLLRSERIASLLAR